MRLTNLGMVQDRIIRLLKEHKELSTGKIGHFIKRNQYQTEARLFDLEEQKKIYQIKRPRGIYWRIKE
jgi:hypothetical protein|tara:strand:- start:681 stop:884 length:204 start_codon:yes stop_codon:yes gene_type:complete